MSPSLLDKSALVVAHPDDEILWFSAILAKVHAIFICFLGHELDPELRGRRRTALSMFPLSNVDCLDITSAGVFDHADWQVPLVSDSGLKLVKDERTFERYKTNHLRMKAELEVRLTGFNNVITHNPWGEYAHEEHVQVFRTVEQLSSKMNFNLWFSNYFSHRSYNLMTSSLDRISFVSAPLKTDKETSKNIMNVYINTGTWTWQKDWIWPESEVFFMHRKETDYTHCDTSLLPLQLVNVPPVNQINRKIIRKGGFLVRQISRIKRKEAPRWLKICS